MGTEVGAAAAFGPGTWPCAGAGTGVGGAWVGGAEVAVGMLVAVAGALMVAVGMLGGAVSAAGLAVAVGAGTLLLHASEDKITSNKPSSKRNLARGTLLLRRNLVIPGIFSKVFSVPIPGDGWFALTRLRGKSSGNSKIDIKLKLQGRSESKWKWWDRKLTQRPGGALMVPARMDRRGERNRINGDHNLLIAHC